MTTLQFPSRTAVGEVWWEDAREPNGSGHRLAISVVEVPDGTAVRLTYIRASVTHIPAAVTASGYCQM